MHGERESSLVSLPVRLLILLNQDLRTSLNLIISVKASSSDTVTLGVGLPRGGGASHTHSAHMYACAGIQHEARGHRASLSVW